MFRMAPNYDVAPAYLGAMAAAQPALIFIHGFPFDGSTWGTQVEGFKDEWLVLAPDLRGFGKDQRALPEVFTMEDHAEDLKALLDEKGIERAVLCGLSMGGYIAMAFLESWPERVVGLVLANTRATADDEAGRQAREMVARHALDQGMEPLARSMVQKLLAPANLEAMPELVERMHRVIARQRPEATAASARGMALRPDRTAWLAGVQVPTLVVTGEADVLMPIQTSEAMARAVPGAELAVLPMAGHLSPLEQPEAFNRTVRAFLLRHFSQ